MQKKEKIQNHQMSNPNLNPNVYNLVDQESEEEPEPEPESEEDFEEEEYSEEEEEDSDEVEEQEEDSEEDEEYLEEEEEEQEEFIPATASPEEEEEQEEQEVASPEEEEEQEVFIPGTTSHTILSSEEFIPATALPRVLSSEKGEKRGEGMICSSAGESGENSQSDQWNRGDIDGLFCPICMEAWTTTGDHHVCCLPCGHIYGFSCIRKWLQRHGTSRRCPLCNQNCTFKDVRKLFASRLVAIDGESQKRIGFLEAKCISLEKESAVLSKKEAMWRKRAVEWQTRAMLQLETHQLKEVSNILSAIQEEWHEDRATLQEEWQTLQEKLERDLVAMNEELRQQLYAEFNYRVQQSLRSGNLSPPVPSGDQ